jgi:hypothetical protein
MFWIIDKIDRIIRDIERVIDLNAQLIQGQRLIVARQDRLEQIMRGDDERILFQLDQLNAIFTPRPAYVAISIGGTMPLQVGSSAIATVTVLDQFGQPFPNFDFGANAPVWSVSDPALASVATGSTPDSETITASAAGSEVLSVSVPGVAKGTSSLSFSVTAPAAVPTSVQIVTSPDITG